MSLFLTLLAVLPGIILTVYIYKKDEIEKEPVKLILKLMIFGALTVFPAAILETFGSAILGEMVSEDSLLFIAIENFLIVGVVEELCKFGVVKLFTWKNPEFDHKFDAIVYSVSSAAGFAILENVYYVADGGLATAILRAIVSVPGHVVMGFFMGCFYGDAKAAERENKKSLKNIYLFLAVFIPVLIHGFYDFCATVDNMTVVFFVFVIALYSYAFAKVDAIAFFDFAFMKSKEAKALDAVIAKLEANMSNNYKDNAQENLKELEALYQQFYSYGKLSKKNIEYYEAHILEYKEKMKGFTHKDQKPFWT